MKRFLLMALSAVILLAGLAVPSLAHDRYDVIRGQAVHVNQSTGRINAGPAKYLGLTLAQAQRKAQGHAVAAPVAAPAAAGTRGARVVAFALAQRGKPYRWGATGPSSYDCSGLTVAAYRAAGKAIPRTSSAQRAAGRVIPRHLAQPGDLIWRPGHIAVYIGGGKQVAARKAGTVIIVQPAMAGGTYLRF